VNARPIYSCLDPEDTGPGPNADGIASYGNLHVTAPYVVHKREFHYHQLGLQKQNHLILATNGAANSRELYTTSAQIVALGQSPDFSAVPFASVVYTIHYVFSGQRNPSLNAGNNATCQLHEPASATSQ